MYRLLAIDSSEMAIMIIENKPSSFTKIIIISTIIVSFVIKIENEPPFLGNPDLADIGHRVQHFCTLDVGRPRHSCKSDDDDHGDSAWNF